jgi:hypothetical protein
VINTNLSNSGETLMKLTSDKKVEMLLDSFNVLKDNIKENAPQLGDILDICLIHNKDLATEIWENLINSNVNLFAKGKDSYKLTTDILFKVFCTTGDHVSEDDFCDIIYSSTVIRNAIFKSAVYLTCFDRVVSHFIRTSELNKANELLMCVSTNMNKESSFESHLADVMLQLSNSNCYNPISSDAIELLTHWIDTIKDKTNKAKFRHRKLKLLSML